MRYQGHETPLMPSTKAEPFAEFYNRLALIYRGRVNYYFSFFLDKSWIWSMLKLASQCLTEPSKVFQVTCGWQTKNRFGITFICSHVYPRGKRRVDVPQKLCSTLILAGVNIKLVEIGLLSHQHIQQMFY